MSTVFFADDVFHEFKSSETVEYQDVVKIIDKCNELGLDPHNMVVRHTDFNTFDNVFPCKFLYHPKQLLYAQTLLRDIESITPSKYFGAFFGNIGSGIRLNLLEKMYNQDLLDYCIWTAYNIDLSIIEHMSDEFKDFLEQNTPRVYVDTQCFNVNPQEIKEFEYTKETRYIRDTNGHDGFMFQECAINVLVDTCAVNKNVRYTTLKVFKPIKYKKPFISTFGKDSLKYLRTLGFKTFNTVWDEIYDDYEPGDKQFDIMVKTLTNLVNTKSIQDIFNETKQICEYNYQLLHDTDWNLWFEKQVRDI
jgi:hypothetical protein